MVNLYLKRPFWGVKNEIRKHQFSTKKVINYREKDQERLKTAEKE